MAGRSLRSLSVQCSVFGVQWSVFGDQIRVYLIAVGLCHHARSATVAAQPADLGRSVNTEH
jgi:hypothetical protein